MSTRNTPAMPPFLYHELIAAAPIIENVCERENKAFTNAREERKDPLLYQKEAVEITACTNGV